MKQATHSHNFRRHDRREIEFSDCVAVRSRNTRLREDHEPETDPITYLGLHLSSSQNIVVGQLGKYDH